MRVQIRMQYDRLEEKIDPIEKIDEILRSSYDYQNIGIDHETADYPDGTTNQVFTFHLDKCDQPKRTLETLRKIEDLIMSYI